MSETPRPTPHPRSTATEAMRLKPATPRRRHAEVEPMVVGPDPGALAEVLAVIDRAPISLDDADARVLAEQLVLTGVARPSRVAGAAALAELLELHTEALVGLCRECLTEWPCRTARLAEIVAGAPTPGEDASQ